VVENGHLAGLLSITDLARALEVGRSLAQALGDGAQRTHKKGEGDEIRGDRSRQRRVRRWLEQP
jgi:hypothetical protein